MSTTGPHLPQDPRIDEREWRSQERAREGSRTGPLAGEDAAAIDAYRRIDAALRRPPAAQLPTDFAAVLAARARDGQRDAARVERRVIGALVLALVACGAVLFALNAEALTAMLRAGLGPRGMLWAASLAVCVVSSWCLDAARRGGAPRALRGT